MITIHRSAQLSVITVVLTSVISALHHIFRLGLTSLPVWIPSIMLPIALITLYKRSQFKNNHLLITYGFVSYAILLWFGVVDGLFDHTFRVLGLQNVTWLPGGDVEFVETAFRIGSVETSHWIFQISGSFVFIASLFAFYFTTRFLWSRAAYNRQQQARVARKHAQQA